MYLMTSIKSRTIAVAILAEVEDMLPDINTTVLSISDTLNYLPLYFFKVKKIIGLKKLDDDHIYTTKAISDFRNTIEDKIIITVLENDSYLFDIELSDALMKKFYKDFNEFGGSLTVERFTNFPSGESVLCGVNDEVSLKYSSMEYYRAKSRTLRLPSAGDYSFASTTFAGNAKEFLRFITSTDVSILSKIYKAGKKVYKDVLIENMSFPLLEYSPRGAGSAVSISVHDMWDRMCDGDSSISLNNCNVFDIEAFLENPAAFTFAPQILDYSLINYLKNNIEVMRLCGSKETRGLLQDMSEKLKWEV